MRHEIIKAIRDYFDSNGFTLVDTPIFTPAACEGTTTLFEVNYFDDEKVYLTQSGQLYNEATAMAFGKVYCFGPDVPRGEVEDAAPPDRVLDGGAGDGLRHAGRRQAGGRGADRASSCGRVLENRRTELKTLERDIAKLEAVQAPFPRISYDEAVKILRRRAARSSGAAISAAPTRRC